MSSSGLELANIIIGSAGSFLILSAYFLLNFNKDLGRFGLQEDSWQYHTLNFVGGGLAAASAILTNEAGSYPLAVLEGVWCIVAFIGLVRLFVRSWKTRDATTQLPLDTSSQFLS